MASDETAGRKAEEDAKPGPPFWAIATAVVVAVLLLFIYAVNATPSFTIVFAVELIVGLAALVSGALLGFLFGIPRTPRATASGAATVTDRAVYEPSNNLEQVSDWLTKILVGATLVQLKELREFLSLIGLRVMQGVGGAATSAVTQLTLIVFGILGFLAGFLWTRVYYGAIQVRADQDIYTLLNRLTQKVDESVKKAREVATATGKMLQSTTTADAKTPQQAVQPLGSPALEQKIQQFMEAPPEWNSDPVEKLFGTGPSSADGLTLVGAVDSILDDESLILTLTVQGGEQRRLEGPAMFLLHPTYAQRIRTAQARNNRASVTIYSESWFHAAAIIGTTVLVLDLRTVTGLPDWFKKD